MKRIGVLGAGTWGMALARMLCVSGHEVTVWSALEREIDEFSETRRHPNLPGMELPQEIVLDIGNPLYVAMHDFCMSMPIGSDAEVPCLLVMPDSSTGEATKGYLWERAVISAGELNSVDGKLTFSMKLSGVKKNGTVTASGGTFVFAEA